MTCLRCCALLLANLLSIRGVVLTSRQSNADPLRVALVGDSLFFGNGSLSWDGRGPEEVRLKPYLKERCSFGVELQKLLQKRSGKVEVKVFARGGTATLPSSFLNTGAECSTVNNAHFTSCSYHDSPEFAAASAYSKQANITVVMLGTNDAKESSTVLKKNYGPALQDILSALGGRLVLMDPPETARPKKFLPASMAVVHSVISSVASALGIPVVSLTDLLPARQKELRVDGIHFALPACVLGAEALLSALEANHLLPPDLPALAG